MSFLDEALTEVFGAPRQIAEGVTVYGAAEATRRLFIACQLLQHDNCTREFHFKGEHHICTCKCHGNS